MGQALSYCDRFMSNSGGGWVVKDFIHLPFTSTLNLVNEFPWKQRFSYWPNAFEQEKWGRFGWSWSLFPMETLSLFIGFELKKAMYIQHNYDSSQLQITDHMLKKYICRPLNWTRAYYVDNNMKSISKEHCDWYLTNKFLQVYFFEQ